MRRAELSLARGTLRGKLPQLQEADDRAYPTSSPRVAQPYLRPSAVPGVLYAAHPDGDRSANGARSSSGGAFDDASRRTSGGSHGLCLGGGHRSEPLSQCQALCLLDWCLPRQSRKSPVNTSMAKPPKAILPTRVVGRNCVGDQSYER